MTGRARLLVDPYDDFLSPSGKVAASRRLYDMPMLSHPNEVARVIAGTSAARTNPATKQSIVTSSLRGTGA
jgi:hypothetical protein